MTLLPPEESDRSHDEQPEQSTVKRFDSLRPNSVKLTAVVIAVVGAAVTIGSFVLGRDSAQWPLDEPGVMGAYTTALLALIGFALIAMAVGLWQGRPLAHAFTVVTAIGFAASTIFEIIGGSANASTWRGLVFGALLLVALAFKDTREWCYPQRAMPMPVAIPAAVQWLWSGTTLALAPLPFLLEDSSRELRWITLGGIPWALAATVLAIALARHAAWARWAAATFAGLSALGTLVSTVVLSSFADAWTAAVLPAGWAVTAAALLFSRSAREWFERGYEPHRGRPERTRAPANALKRTGITLTAVAAVLAVLWLQSVFVRADDGDLIGEGRPPFDSSTCNEFDFSGWEEIAGEFYVGGRESNAEEFEKEGTGRVWCGGMSTLSGNVRSGELTVEAVVESSEAAATGRSEEMFAEYTEQERWTVDTYDRGSSISGYRAVEERGTRVVLWFATENLVISVDGSLNGEAGIDTEAEAVLEDLLDQAETLFEGYTD